MISEEIVLNLKEKFSNIHPLIFQRSVDYAESGAELFDILDLIPNEYPLIFCFENKRWVHTDDLVNRMKFDFSVVEK